VAVLLFVSLLPTDGERVNQSVINRAIVRHHPHEIYGEVLREAESGVILVIE
jgi:hypothetical protein